MVALRLCQCSTEVKASFSPTQHLLMSLLTYSASTHNANFIFSVYTTDIQMFQTSFLCVYFIVFLLHLPARLCLLALAGKHIVWHSAVVYFSAAWRVKRVCPSLVTLWQNAPLLLQVRNFVTCNTSFESFSGYKTHLFAATFHFSFIYYFLQVAK